MRICGRRLFRGGVMCWAVIWAVPAGCRSAAGYRADFASANPLDRAQAAVQAAERGDAAAVHHLVDLLDDRSEAVRMYAILALRRLCEEDFGYRYYADEAERAEAVAHWRAALRAGGIVMSNRKPTAIDDVPAVADAQDAVGVDERGAKTAGGPTP